MIISSLIRLALDASDLWQLNVSVDVEPVVLAGQHDRAVVHQRDVEALGVFHLALQRRQKLKKAKYAFV